MIINQTKKTIISQRERLCTSFLSQCLGLMFRPRQNLVMVFPEERKISLQMFFVFYPITVLVVNKEQRVVEIKENFRPFTFWSSTKKGKWAVELGEKQGGVKVGDLISIVEENKAHYPKNNWEEVLYGKKWCKGILSKRDIPALRKKFRRGLTIR